MMEVSVVRADDKFRIVIPKKLRDASGLGRNPSMLMYAFSNVLLLQKVEADRGIILDIARRVASGGGENER